MTAQISDSFIYFQEEYELAFADPEIELHPKQFGIHTYSSLTACWRGFKRTFELDGENLILQTLDLNDRNKEKNTPINQIFPITNSSEDSFFDKTYNNIKLRLNFTGKICIAKDFIWEHYVHGGFHPAWKYETVIELVFFKGVLINKKDISEELKEKRENFKISKRPDKDYY